MSGLAVVLCAPSGTGKTTIARTLVDRYDDLAFSVSATTRAPRKYERPGVDYHFVSRDRFESMIAGGELLEWAEVHDELYGTPRANLAEAARHGKDLVLDIDVQGGRQVVEARPDTVTVFLLPPSADAMLQRLRGRGTEDAEQLARRIRTARAELGAMDEFAYVLVNDRLDGTLGSVRSIIRAERHRRERVDPEVEALRRRILEDLTRYED